MITRLPGALWLQKRTASLIGAVGAYVMGRLAPVVLRLQLKYESAPSGGQRLVASVQFRAAVELHHLSFKIAKRAQQVKLRLSGVDEVLLELERKFGHLGGRYPRLLAPFGELPKLLDDICAAADKVDDELSRLKKTIEIHWKNPRLDAETAARRIEDGKDAP